MKKYAYSYDREDYSGSFDSPEDAVSAAVRNVEGIASPPTEIYVGVIVNADPQAADHAQQIVDAMNNRAHVDYGDAAARYLKNITPAQVAELDKDIERTILAWLERNSLMPKFVKVGDVREYPMPFPAQATPRQPENGEVHEIGTGRLPPEEM